MDDATLVKLLEGERFQATTGVRLPRELERALKVVARGEGAWENRDDVEGVAGLPQVRALVDLGMVEYVNTNDPKEYGYFGRIQRTIAGRSYFSERRRDRMERHAPVVVGSVLGGLFTILGAVLGYALAVIGGGR